MERPRKANTHVSGEKKCKNSVKNLELNENKGKRLGEKREFTDHT